MEAKVFSDPRIQKLLHEKYIIVALYADDKTIVPEEDWVVTANGTTLKHLGKINSYFAMTKYKVNAQPFYALVDPNTEQFLGEPRGYNLDVEAFIDFLSAKLEAKGY